MSEIERAMGAYIYLKSTTEALCARIVRAARFYLTATSRKENKMQTHEDKIFRGVMIAVLAFMALWIVMLSI